MSKRFSLDQFRENVALAIDTLRVSKLRSGLTMLGVIIGVATVMTMGTIVNGVQSEILTTIQVAGPTTFYVLRVVVQGDPNNLPPNLRNRPPLDEATADRISALPTIAYAGIWAQLAGRLESPGARTQPLTIYGADNGFPDIQGGDLLSGRWFTRAELHSGARVVVLAKDQASFLFGEISPLGREVRVDGVSAQVIGVWQAPDNIFAPQGQGTGAVIPYRFALHALNFDKRQQQMIPVKPRATTSVDDAEADVTVAVRELRHLRPGDSNTFDLITQDQILASFNSISGAFFLVMMVLASVALMVGGIGVMAVMMVSVTARTREIGVRKALGATQGDILAQFLVEAATLTGIGGMAGILVGLGAGRGGMFLMHIQGTVPIPLTMIAVAVSVGIGLVFGVVPALKAARLDPIEALRYE
jgi:putative ABC transport system permease protein